MNDYTRYRHLAFDDAKPPATAKQLAAVEDMLGARLPDSFRDFLRVAHGAYLEYNIDVAVGAGKTEVMCYCGIFDFDELEDETLAWREMSNLPNGVLPFARDGGGFVVFLDLSPNGTGAVVAFVEGLPAWTGLHPDSVFIKVASSFDEYVEKLHIDRDELLGTLATRVRERGQIDATKEFLDIALPRWREDPDLVAAIEAATKRVG